MVFLSSAACETLSPPLAPLPLPIPPLLFYILTPLCFLLQFQLLQLALPLSFALHTHLFNAPSLVYTFCNYLQVYNLRIQLILGPSTNPKCSY